MHSAPPASQRRLLQGATAALLLMLFAGPHPSTLPGASATTDVVLNGTVTDASGDPLPRAKVTVIAEAADGDTLATLFTDQQGRYQTNITGVAAALPSEKVPTTYAAGGAYPHPLSAGQTRAVQLRYTTPGNQPADPTLELFDLLGRRVDPEQPLAADLYFYRLRFHSGTRTDAKRLVLTEGGRLRFKLVQAKVRLDRPGASTAPLDAAKREARAKQVRVVAQKNGYVTKEQTVRLEDEDRQVNFALEAKELVHAGSFERIYDPSIGEEEDWYINDHCFIQGEDGAWHLYGITHPEPADPLDEDHFAHATARRLTQRPWQKQPFALSAQWDPWREVHLWAPHVIRHEGTYYMFYTAGAKDHSQYKTHLATSQDLKDWTRHPENPVVVDGYDARDPFILRHGGEWIMYYTATSDPEGGNHIVAYRTSDDLIEWGQRRVAYTDSMKGTRGGPTESPTVVRRGEYFYLFIGPTGGYRTGYVGTAVYRSKSPFHWDQEAQVGRIESHAAEVVRDEEGTWYVSHAGWGQGGVYLAPLFWEDGLEDAPTSVPVPNRSQQ